MTLTHFKPAYQQLFLFVFVTLFPFIGYSNTEEAITEKRIRVAMRMIGHEVLLCLGDSDSRVMPIERTDEHYKIPFEFEFGFDPDDIVSIVTEVMAKTQVATNYLVEVEQCETKEVVHSFEIGNPEYSDLRACGGRSLPMDCYSLLISVLDNKKNNSVSQSEPSDTSLAETYPISEELSHDSFSFTSVLMVPMLILIGFIGWFVRKKNPEKTDPNCILIGATQFDKKNRRLSFENKNIDLSHKEGELLSLLLANVNTPVNREDILRKVWGDEGDYIGRTLDVFISKLRKKLDGDESVKIVNIRGVGYKLLGQTHQNIKGMRSR